VTDGQTDRHTDTADGIRRTYASHRMTKTLAFKKLARKKHEVNVS